MAAAAWNISTCCLSRRRCAQRTRHKARGRKLGLARAHQHGLACPPAELVELSHNALVVLHKLTDTIVLLLDTQPKRILLRVVRARHRRVHGRCRCDGWRRREYGRGRVRTSIITLRGELMLPLELTPRSKRRARCRVSTQCLLTRLLGQRADAASRAAQLRVCSADGWICWPYVEAEALTVAHARQNVDLDFELPPAVHSPRPLGAEHRHDWLLCRVGEQVNGEARLVHQSSLELHGLQHGKLAGVGLESDVHVELPAFNCDRLPFVVPVGLKACVEAES
mmetsp:Transcript_22400/g.57561  ORF Transcript_22400/g.57561 Transcript_22400/m.57561 type:complete len:281 (-) Transcript_22400:168-1010(-)